MDLPKESLFLSGQTFDWMSLCKMADGFSVYCFASFCALNNFFLKLLYCISFMQRHMHGIRLAFC